MRCASDPAYQLPAACCLLPDVSCTLGHWRGRLRPWRFDIGDGPGRRDGAGAVAPQLRRGRGHPARRQQAADAAADDGEGRAEPLRHGAGLEVGSKPELQAVLALTERTDHLIVCNGYKDEEYMRLALMGQRLGHTVLIVLEKISEVDTLLKVADAMMDQGLV